MKKVLLTSLVLIASTSHANVDYRPSPDGFDFYAGMAGWYTGAKGNIDAPSINYSLALEEEDIDKNFNGIFFTAFEHPLRYLPDVRLSQTRVSQDGTGTLTFGSSYPIEGTLDLSHTDLTLYYNVVNHSGFLDLGLTVRTFNGELYLNILPGGPSSTSDLSTTLGLLYLKTGMTFPLEGLSMGFILNAGANGDERSADGTLYLQYETPYGLGVNGGYRYMNTDIAGEGSLGPVTIDISADMDIYGSFMTLYYHF